MCVLVSQRQFPSTPPPSPPPPTWCNVKVNSGHFEGCTTGPTYTLTDCSFTFVIWLLNPPKTKVKLKLYRFISLAKHFPFKGLRKVEMRGAISAIRRAGSMPPSCNTITSHKSGSHAICNRRPREAICHLLNTDTCHRSFLLQGSSFGAKWDKCLNIICDSWGLVCTICYPRALHTSKSG